ncbi:MAG: F0F1 ATP synthase subunit gamma [Candidatus Competibacter sp.]|nr:F0F1 ATP synthase subunit gamma [Candidatus Competibacter sp.]MDG4585262.1 F0F1 ATP synthase subunit gamma [Candidatus Competibacter sp.]
MPALEALRHTLATVGELRSIVRTMKALAAVSIHQYERAGVALIDYDRAVRRGLAVVLEDLAAEAGARGVGLVGPLDDAPPGDKPVTGAVVFGSDHGLCGRFNEVLAAYVAETLRESAGICRVLAVGVRQVAALEEQGLAPEQRFYTPAAASAIHQTMRPILPLLEQWRTEGVTQVLLFHNRHRGSESHEPASTRLLPLDPDALRREPSVPSRSLPGYAVGRADLLAALLQEWLFVELFRACAESLASEHASRLLAMQAAERNIADRLAELNTAYRQQRQEAITAELLDVVAGFEALVTAGDHREKLRRNDVGESEG